MNKLALISLRNDYLENRNEIRDSVDTQIYDLISEINLIPLLIPNSSNYVNSVDKIVNYKKIECLILSGGNDLSILKDKGAKNICTTRDDIEINLIKFCIKKNIPIIGICRGFQLVATYLGAIIDKTEEHVNNIHEVNFNDDSCKSIYVNSFHTFGLKSNNLPSNIKPLGFHYKDNTIECFITEEPFRSLNFMWHPERLNGARKESLNLIKNFLKM